MNRIHRKSAIAKTADLLRAAHDVGIEFLWDRYEKQLPLCAFTANGLSCRKCFHGPCRINPFGDEPDRGVCGADRDQIVMQNLFQSTLEGVLETARTAAILGEDLAARELPDLAPDLPPETLKRVSERGILPVHKSQLHTVQNSFFAHKGFLPQTLSDLTRLGLIHYGILKGMEEPLNSLPRGNPSFDRQGINILMVGQPSRATMGHLFNRAERSPEGKKVNLLLRGAKAFPGFFPAADQGSPELALAMNLDAVVIAPDASFPGLADLAGRIGLPMLLADESLSPDRMAEMAFDLAFKHHQEKSYLTPSLLLPPPITTPLTARGQDVRAALEEGRVQGILVILGENNVKQTFFERTLTLAEYGIKQSLMVLIGGELAAQADFLNEELNKRLGGKSFLSSLGYMGPLCGISQVVAFLKDLVSAKVYDRVPAVISFPEFFRGSTWATAVSFLSLGFAVQIGSPLPFWGSPALTGVLLKDWPQVSGGTLLASPSLPDTQDQAEEIGSFLRAQKSRR
jgi:hypothetical protein